MQSYLGRVSLKVSLSTLRSSWIRMGPKSNDWCPHKRSGNVDTETQTHRGKGHVMTEAEIRVMHLQAKEY